VIVGNKLHDNPRKVKSKNVEKDMPCNSNLKNMEGLLILSNKADFKIKRITRNEDTFHNHKRINSSRKHINLKSICIQ
jgi:hypothetical protein